MQIFSLTNFFLLPPDVNTVLSHWNRGRFFKNSTKNNGGFILVCLHLVSTARSDYQFAAEFSMTAPDYRYSQASASLNITLMWTPSPPTGLTCLFE